MKKRWLVGAVVMILAVLFVLTPKVGVGATTSDFRIEDHTLVEYTGTATTVSVPANVEKIGRSAFENNIKIKKITIPDSVTEIEEYAFWGCENLETVVLGEGLWEIADFTFTACKSLKKVVIPENIKRIGIMAFADCTGLSDIAIPASVTDIHSTAFDGITNLNIHAKEYSYPYRYALERGQNPTNKPMPTNEPQPESSPIPTPSLTPEPTNRPIGTVIGSTTIVGNSAVLMMDSRIMDAAEGKEADIIQLSPPIKADKVTEWNYYGDKTLKSIVLDEGITEIGKFGFARSGLKRIVIPEGTTSIKYAAFYHCDELKDVMIPSTVTNIEAKAFTFTPWLREFMDGKNKEQGDFLIVGDGVLLAYRGMKEQVIIPEGVKYIAPEVFLGHKEIQQLQFPNSLIRNDDASINK